MIKQNINQFFKIFPDSTVHLRKKWTITDKQEGEYGLVTKTTVFVKAINENRVYIESYAAITSNEAANNLRTKAKLNGGQTGEYILEEKKGMLLSATLKMKVNGTVEAQNLEIPIPIFSDISMKGEKLK